MNYSSYTLIILFIFIFSKPISEMHPGAQLAIWNIGQGQWVTFRFLEYCFHFDQGGEWAPLVKINQFCAHRENLILISHTDYDHINFIGSWLKFSNSNCLLFEAKPHPQKVRKYVNLKMCPNPHLNNFLFFNTKQKSTTKIKANDYSIISVFSNQFMITGDAPQKIEKSLDLNRSIKVLVLGHHGSKTSTSQSLLTRVSPLLAVASQRKARYGHPHQEVVDRLKKNQIPLLKTEDWGSIIIDLK